MQPRAGLRQFPGEQPTAWAVREGGHMHREWGQAQRGWDTVSTRQCFVYSIPPSPQFDWTSEPKKKCPPPPLLCQGENQTLKRPANRSENRGNRLGSDRCNRLKPCRYYRLQRKGPIDLEKYTPDQGSIRKWTDPTLPTTTPEEVLGISLLFLRSFFFCLFVCFFFSFSSFF